MPRPAKAKRPDIVARLTPEVVLDWLPESVLRDAADNVERGALSRPAIRSDRIEAIAVDPVRGRVRVRLEWGANAPRATCACGDAAAGPCRHAAALAIMVAGVQLPTRMLADEDGEPTAARDTAAQREQKLRIERGASELFTVTAGPGTRIFGRYSVVSPSSRAYEVAIRALDALHNSCSCADLETNLLGTCKHIEAVLHHLRRRHKTRLQKARAEGAPASYLHLDCRDPEALMVGLKLVGRPAAAERRFASRFFGSGGRLQRPLVMVWPELERAAVACGIEVPSEVAGLAHRELVAATRARRESDVEAAVVCAGTEQPGFRARLYPYQVAGVAFLVSRERALLADDMGLGKTAQAIAGMLRLARAGDVRRTLIVAPASLKHQWQREIERFGGLGGNDVAVVGGPREERRRACERAPAVLITSYELARLDEDLLIELSPDLLILDEAQRIKNWRTQTASGVKRIPSRFCFVLTGTPLENRLDDLYSLMQVIDPHRLGPLWRFNEEFTAVDERGRVQGFRNLQRLRERLAPVFLRRRKEEVLADLPARVVNRLAVPMTAEQTAIHDGAEAQVRQFVAILKRRPLVPIEERRLMAAFQRMRMACDAAGLVDGETEGSPKLDELHGLLEEIAVQGGHKVVVFSEWEKMQAMAAKVCERLKLGFVRFHGGVATGARPALLDRFRDDPACMVFLSTDAGGVGLNLQTASHLINLDLPWNPAVLNQRIARVHRIGQNETVNIVLLVSQASFEEKMEGTLAAKQVLAAASVGDDTDTDSMERTTLAGRIATLLGAEFAAPTGRDRLAVPMPLATLPPDPVAVLRERLGPTLERVLRLGDGRLVAVLAGAAPPVATLELEPGAAPILLLPAAAADALAVLGASSPFAAADTLWVAAGTAPDPLLGQRRARLAAAERKLAAAESLIAGSQFPGEALGLLHAALALACRGFAERVDPGDDPAALLAAVYGELVPAGLLLPTEAAALARAGELARAFGSSPLAPPEKLVADVAGDARDLITRLRTRIGASGTESAT